MTDQEALQAIKDRVAVLEDRCEELRAAILSVMNLAIEATLMQATDDLAKKKQLSAGLKGRVQDVAKLLYPSEADLNG